MWDLVQTGLASRSGGCPLGLEVEPGAWNAPLLFRVLPRLWGKFETLTEMWGAPPLAQSDSIDDA